jgi:hypothetical protein
MNDEIRVKLTITSSTLPPDKITELVRMEPDSKQVLGEMNRLGTKSYPHHAWIVRKARELTGPATASELHDVVSEFLVQLAPSREFIKELSSKHDVELGLYIFTREVPSLGLSARQVQDISALGASIDIDVVLYSDS